MRNRLFRGVFSATITTAILGGILLLFRVPLPYVGGLAIGIFVWTLLTAIVEQFITVKNGFVFDALEWRVDVKYFGSVLFVVILLNSFGFFSLVTSPLFQMPIFLSIFSVARIISRLNIRQTILQKPKPSCCEDQITNPSNSAGEPTERQPLAESREIGLLPSPVERELYCVVYSGKNGEPDPTDEMLKNAHDALSAQFPKVSCVTYLALKFIHVVSEKINLESLPEEYMGLIRSEIEPYLDMNAI